MTTAPSDQARWTGPHFVQTQLSAAAMQHYEQRARELRRETMASMFSSLCEWLRRAVAPTRSASV